MALNRFSATVKCRQSNADSFFYGWLFSYGAGVLLGLLAVQASRSSIGDEMVMLCRSACPGGRLQAGPLFASSICFFLLTILFSQLSGGFGWTLFLTGFKAFCTAYVFGVFYVLQQQLNLQKAVLSLAIHTVFLLPALFELTRRCSTIRLHGKGRFWFRYRICPLLLLFGYLVGLFCLESALFAKI